jgi:hypothetical protein
VCCPLNQGYSKQKYSLSQSCRSECAVFFSVPAHVSVQVPVAVVSVAPAAVPVVAAAAVDAVAIAVPSAAVVAVRAPLPSCQICDECFTRTTHCPRNLPCGHYYCAQCLTQMLNTSRSQAFRCPQGCAPVSVVSVDNLGKNFAVLDQLP